MGLAGLIKKFFRESKEEEELDTQLHTSIKLHDKIIPKIKGGRGIDWKKYAHHYSQIGAAITRETWDLLLRQLEDEYYLFRRPIPRRDPEKKKESKLWGLSDTGLQPKLYLEDVVYYFPTENDTKAYRKAMKKIDKRYRKCKVVETSFIY